MAGIDYSDLIGGQREYFHSGATRRFRGGAGSSRRCRRCSTRTAVASLPRFATVSVATTSTRNLMDVGFCIREAEYALDHMNDWMKITRQQRERSQCAR